MKRVCIAIVDAARARLYTYQEDAEPGRQLREVRDLTNPGRRMKAGEMFSETRPALARGGGRIGMSGEPGSTKDDHRDDHIEMMDTKFAKEIFDEIEQVLRTEAYGRLILASPPKMLGELRKAGNGLRHNGVVIDEVPEGLSYMTAAQLHDHLAALSLIPGRTRLRMDPSARRV
jgi:protein required for attachment to host cells